MSAELPESFAKSIEIRNLAELRNFAESFLAEIFSNSISNSISSNSLNNSSTIKGSEELREAKEVLPKFVGLKGSLGAGKTQFVKFIAQELGIKEEVTSPTYNLENQYSFDLAKIVGNSKIHSSIKPQSFATLYHLDIYRLQSQEGERQGLDFLTLDDELGFYLIEWSEVLSEIYAKIEWEIEFCFVEEEIGSPKEKDTREEGILEKLEKNTEKNLENKIRSESFSGSNTLENNLSLASINEPYSNHLEGQPRMIICKKLRET